MASLPDSVSASGNGGFTTTRFRQALAALLLTHLLAIVVLAVAPQWHDWLHDTHAASDAGEHSHECSVTLFLHGSVEAPAAPISGSSAALWTGEQFFSPLADASWVASVFALSRVFEHGPPSLRG